MDAEIVQKSPHFLCLALGPIEVRGVKLDTLIAHSGDGADRSGEVLFQRIAHRIQFEASGDSCRAAGAKSPREDRRESQKGTARVALRSHRCILPDITGNFTRTGGLLSAAPSTEGAALDAANKNEIACELR
jgi:hypothetical protein